MHFWTSRSPASLPSRRMLAWPRARDPPPSHLARTNRYLSLCVHRPLLFVHPSHSLSLSLSLFLSLLPPSLPLSLSLTLSLSLCLPLLLSLSLSSLLVPLQEGACYGFEARVLAGFDDPGIAVGIEELKHYYIGRVYGVHIYIYIY